MPTGVLPRCMWHLGSGKGDLPDAHGFDLSFALDASGADNWEDKSYMPYYADAPWYEDGKIWMSCECDNRVL